jgi:hypothetical protein
MRYRLRTLLIVLALGPPIIGFVVYAFGNALVEFVIDDVFMRGIP